jgi:hypothetical protein
MNSGEMPVTLDFSRYGQRTGGFTKGVDVLTGQQYSLDQKTSMPGRTMWVLELRR